MSATIKEEGSRWITLLVVCIARPSICHLERENVMKQITTLALSAAALLYAGNSAAMAQSSPPSYQADPDVYKVIFEDQNFRVITGTWNPGVHDKTHSHPVPSVVYALTDCMSRIYGPDGKATESTSKAGTAHAVPIIQSHSAENIGPAACRVVFVERK
jgi:hypothetical protein